MYRPLFISIALLGSFSLASAASDEAPDVLGFDAAGSSAQLALEAEFDALLDRDNLDKWMKRLSAHPHHTGSPWGKDNAEFIARLMREWGYEVEIETFYVLYPTPKLRLLEMIEPQPFTARLEEPALPEDSTSSQKDEQLPIFNAYSADGDVTAEVVFVNQGIPADYEDLERMGIDVKGKLVIAKYGGSWRGIKPKVAAEHGAVGVILYSDPEDDGYYQGDDYPEGPYRRLDGAQRGSVLDMPKRPGDPLTPNIGATRDAERLSVEEAETIMTIPVLPISYMDALPILDSLKGPVAPERWRGALPITYHVGPGPAKVHLKLEFNWDLAPAYNVIARLEGSEFPDQWVIRGNHHDAWVNGAGDPVSGLVTVLEEARVIAELVKNGYRPKRTIIFAAWDAEEPALLGSTEWVEQHAEELSAHAVAYLNSDGVGRGFLFAGGSHTLEAMVNEIARVVIDPQTGLPVNERLRARTLVEGDEEAKARAEDSADVYLAALGSGSDYTPFLQHLGIASLNMSFGGEGGGGSYHSIFDSYDYFTRFQDPGFTYVETAAKVTGRALMRLANANLLPFEFTRFSATIERYITELQALADDMREETKSHNKLVEMNAYEAAADPTKPYEAPEAKDEVPFFNFAALENALVRLQASSDRLSGLMADWQDLSADDLAALNGVLMLAERALIREDGLPRRPWFRHQIYAPGYYTGYGVKTLPGVREGIEEREWAEAEAEILILADVLSGFAAEIDRASAILAGDQ